MRKLRIERTEDRKSGVTTATRIPLDAYLEISDILALRGSNINQLLCKLALGWLAAQRPPQPISIEEELARR